MGSSVFYEYDGFNRLTDVSEGINKAEYEYNTSGIRTSKTVNGEKTDFILDGIYVIAEIKDGDVTNYIRGVMISERRINDKITSFELYSHGLEFNGGTIELGYRQDNANSLSLNSNNIKRMNWSAFEGCTSKFYSCNTGKAGYNSFAQNWVNITGGKAIASKNKTTYVPVGYYLNSDQKNSIKYYGFNVFGSNYQPIPSDGGSWLTFTKIDGR